MSSLKMMGAYVVKKGCRKWYGQGCMLSFTCKRLLSSSSIPRINREDIKSISYDSSFSPWKILIGGRDWREHSSGKEGAERYRTQNLPTHTTPGAYELGIATSAAPARNLEAASVIPVYLGHAGDVRARLQRYGRSGAHLGHHLFSGVFSTDLPIVYRWARMESKERAERMEDELLGLYDYAWNKRNNAHRRPHHILSMLTHKQSQFHFSTFLLLYLKTIKCSMLTFCTPPK
ncbi:protein EFFECTOR OF TRANSCRIPTION 2-like [Salvia miltiorrhiza]|uniref:protein EFFECTOR OF TRANSCRIPTION 2-like n=1 Tax=Salvia miltiorrhiza TaxID=226208 RepID=UPI0025ACD2DB|nr:protein EFFECTOR OF TRANSCRIPTION 2-like [Salvia miltiorrhiza]